MNSSVTSHDVVVVGAGMAGLTAAWALASDGLDVLLLEKDNRVGGRVKTIQVGEEHIESGAAFVSGFYSKTLETISKIGLSDDLVQGSQRAYIADRRSLQPIWPAGALFGGGAISNLAKLRMLRVVPPLVANWKRLEISDLSKVSDLDVQSAGRYLEKRVGSENVAKFFAPLLRGLLYWDVNATTYPIVLAVLKAFATNGSSTRMKGGLSRIAVELARGVSCRTGVDVRRISRYDGRRFTVEADAAHGSQIMQARAVIVATTATACIDVVEDLEGPVKDLLQATKYSSTAMLTFMVPVGASGYPPGSVLFPVPGVADLAAFNAHVSLVDTGNRATRPLHVYLSDEGFHAYKHLTDAEMGRVVIGRLREILGELDWMQRSELANVQRWPQALPHFDVGHIKAIESVQSYPGEIPQLAFAGDYLGGPYLDGAVRSGLSAADQVRRSLDMSVPRIPVE